MQYAPGRNLLYGGTQNIQCADAHPLAEFKKAGALAVGHTYRFAINCYTEDECGSFVPHINGGNNGLNGMKTTPEGTRIITPTETPTTYWCTFVYDPATNIPANAATAALCLYKTDANTPGTIYINWIMLTEGDEEYDYRPAPEDTIQIGLSWGVVSTDNITL